MTARRIRALVDAVLANRHPRAFAADTDDVDAMRVLIGLDALRPGASVPRPEFVADLRRRLADEISGRAGGSHQRGTGPFAVDA